MLGLSRLRLEKMKNSKIAYGTSFDFILKKQNFDCWGGKGTNFKFLTHSMGLIAFIACYAPDQCYTISAEAIYWFVVLGNELFLCSKCKI